MITFIKRNRYLFTTLGILLLVGIVLACIFILGGTKEDLVSFFYFYGFVSIVVVIKQVHYIPIKWK